MDTDVSFRWPKIHCEYTKLGDKEERANRQKKNAAE